MRGPADICRSWRGVMMRVLILGIVPSTGCVYWSVNVREMSVARPLAAPPTDVELQVDKARNNDRGEALTLEDGLNREFKRAGYRFLPGDLKVKAAIIDLNRGNVMASFLLGAAAGAEGDAYADVQVR